MAKDEIHKFTITVPTCHAIRASLFAVIYLTMVFIAFSDKLGRNILLTLKLFDSLLESYVVFTQIKNLIAEVNYFLIKLQVVIFAHQLRNFFGVAHYIERTHRHSPPAAELGVGLRERDLSRLASQPVTSYPPGRMVTQSADGHNTPHRNIA